MPVWEKQQGYVLSVDPATISCGVSLWRDGQFVASRKLCGGSLKLPLSVRMRRLFDDYEQFLVDMDVDVGEIHTIVTENVRSKFLLVTIGLFFVPFAVKAPLKNSHFIVPGTWKKWAQGMGALGPAKDIKGLKALREIGWDFDANPVGTEDEADSVFIYKAWAAKG